METTTRCLCGCDQSDVAIAARQARAADAARRRDLNSAAFERYYADLTTGREVLDPAAYYDLVEKEAPVV